jgi:hypothetical protein
LALWKQKPIASETESVEKRRPGVGAGLKKARDSAGTGSRKSKCDGPNRRYEFKFAPNVSAIQDARRAT